MSKLPPAYYLPDGDGFVATALTKGPWSEHHQHGGPPCALLAGALARAHDTAPGFFVARITYDYIKPVPLGRAAVRVEAVKLGRATQTFEGTLSVDGVDVLHARALRIRRAPLTGLPPPPPAPALPSEQSSFVFPFFRWSPAYHSSLETRFARGQWGDAQVFVWVRPLVPLVEGRATSGLERVALIADAESGLCPPLSIDGYTFINPDLTLVLDREPEGDWLGLDATSTASPVGVGIAQAGLFDAQGLLGRSAQTLVVEPRAAPAKERAS